jgi:hypothetical protein
MLTIPKFGLTTVPAILIAASSIAGAEDPAALQQKLESKYSLTTINAEGGVVISGATLTLKKPGLIAGAKSCTLDYKNGALALASISKATCTVGKATSGGIGGFVRSRIPVPGGTPDPQAARLFVPGEKLWITKITIAADVIGFTLVSDTINNVVYNSVVRVQPQPGATPDFAQADQMISEMFTVTPSDTPQQTAAAPGAGAAPPQVSGASPVPVAPAQNKLADIPPPPPAPQDKLPDIAPPPPPSDQPAAPPQTLSLGLTIDQVVAILGQPVRIADVGSKKIYTYKDLKITFVDGKVTDMQ